MTLQFMSSIFALQLLVVAANRITVSTAERVFLDGVAEELQNESVGVIGRHGQESSYCDNVCPHGMTQVTELDASEFPMLEESERKLVRCVAPGVQEDGYPPFFILNAKAMVKTKEKVFYNVGRLDLMAVVTWAFEKTFADVFDANREKTEEEQEIEAQILADPKTQELQEIHEHHGAHAHTSAEIVGHFLLEEAALKGTKYGLKYLAYNVIGHAAGAAATFSAIVSGAASFIGMVSCFSIALFPVTYSMQACWAVQQMSDAIADAGTMGSYLYYKYPYVNLFGNSDYSWQNMRPEFRSLCGDEIAQEMMASMKETAVALKNVLGPLTALGGCTVPAVTTGPGGDKVNAKTNCIKHVWDILSLGPYYNAAQMSVTYSAIADQFYNNFYGSTIKNAWKVKVDDVPNVLENIVNSADQPSACKLAVKMDQFYRTLFQKLTQILTVWNRSFLRAYGTGMVCSRPCKDLINVWNNPQAQLTCNYGAPRVVDQAVISSGDKNIFANIPQGHIPWGSLKDAFKKVILKMDVDEEQSQE